MVFMYLLIVLGKFLENSKISDLKKYKKMHFPYYFLVKNQWFEKLTKGTALGGLSPLLINHPVLINPCRKIFQFFGR